MIASVHMDVNMNKCKTCAYYQPRIFYCEYYLKGKETAIYLCPHYRRKNEEMQEVVNKDAFYGEALND